MDAGLGVVTSVGSAHLAHLPRAATSLGVVAADLGPSDLQWVIVLDGAGPPRSAPTSGDVTEAAREDLGDLGSAVRTALTSGIDVRVLATLRPAGTFTARNHGLAVIDRPWLVNLDADDELLPGVTDVVTAVEAAGLLWGAGRTELDGGALDHCALTGVVAPGAVHDAWLATGMTRPPVFPGGLLVDTRLALAVGGWPALTFAADTGLLLGVSEVATGLLHPAPVLRYHTWADQISGSPDRPATFDERCAFMRRRVGAARDLGLRCAAPDAGRRADDVTPA